MRIYIIIIIWLLCRVTFAAPDVKLPVIEKPSLTAAKAALEAGMFELALQQVRRVMDMPDADPSVVGAAVIVNARILHAQERFDAILNLLDEARILSAPPPAAAEMRFWRAMAFFSQQNYANALDELGRLDADGQSVLAPRALRLRAWCLLRTGKTEKAMELFSRFDRSMGDTPEGVINLYEWSRALLDTGDTAKARQQLDALIGRAASPAETVQDARLLLARVLIQERKHEKATTVLETLANDEASRPDRRADAWFALAELQRDRTNYDQALTGISRGLELAPTPELKRRGTISQGQIMLKLGRTEEGAAALKRVITAEPERPQSGQLQLELAHAWYDAGNGVNAAQEYQYYLETFTNRAGRAEAAAGRGMALFSVARYAEAAGAFEKALLLIDDPEGRAQALFKIGDARFANNQFITAAEAYQQMVTAYPASVLVPQAVCQAGESLMRGEQRPAAARLFQQVLAKYPNHTVAERAALRLAECHEEMGETDLALAGYRTMLETYTNSPLYVNALHRRGMLFYRMFRFEDALNSFSRVVSDFDSSPMAEQAYFMRGWSLYMLGRDEEALDVCRSFVTQYTNSEYAAGVLFWIGEYQYNHGRHAEASAVFKTLLEKYPNDQLADDAVYWSGRAALERKEYLQAIELFGRLTKNYPASSKLAEARFHQGEAMRELGDLSTAILVFQEIVTRYPTNAMVRPALIRKGDCQFSLGTGDARRYMEALESYRLAMDGEGVAPEMRLQIEYKIGRCLEKLGRTDEAMEHYYTRVVCRYFEERNRQRFANPTLDMWFTRAAFAATDLLETQSNWRRAVKVLQRVMEAGVPAARDAQERINRIKTEHWSLFF